VCSSDLGSANPYANIAPTMMWVILWVGFAYVSAFFGNLWALLNPWRILFDGAAWLVRRAPRGILPYPAALGLWPACALLSIMSWIELVYPEPANPRAMGWFALAYALVTWTGMALFGSAAWTRNGEVFSVMFGVFARFAPVETERGWALRPFAAGLLGEENIGPSLMGFVLLLLATVLYDGALGTPQWGAFEDAVAAYLPAGDFSFLAIRTAGLIGFWLVFLGAFLAVSALMRRAMASARSTSALAQEFALTLVPIAIGYHLAHYLLFLIVQGQYVIPLASDPFGFGWNLFGTAGYRVDIAALGARAAWYIAVSAILLAHVIAVYLAHLKAIRLSERGAALRGQVPLTALMVLYTFISLSILAEPITERRSPEAASDATVISVPADALLPDASGKLIALGAGKTARMKLTYRFLSSNFQDGAKMSQADLLYAMSFAYRWSSEADGRAHFDPAVAAATATMRRMLLGFRLTGIDSNSKSFRVGDFAFERDLFLVEAYLDAPPQDSEQDAAYAPPWSTVPWTVLALMEEAATRGWAAFSQEEAKRRNVPWLDLARSPLLPRLAALVDDFAKSGFRPAALQNYVSVEEAQKRWAALAAFYRENKNFLVTNGPYKLKSWSGDSATLESYRDLSYPLGVGSFDAYAVPRRGFVTKIERAGARLKISGDIETEMKFQRSYKLLRGAIQSIDARILTKSAPECRYMLLDGSGEVARADRAMLGNDGIFTIDLGAGLAAGEYTLFAEIVVNGNAMNAEIKRFAFSLP
jgi:hypothetical protein